MGALLLDDTHCDSILLSFVILVGHGENLDAEDDAADAIDCADNAASNNSEDDSENTSLGLALNEERNTDSVEEYSQNTKYDLVHDGLPPYLF